MCPALANKMAVRLAVSATLASSCLAPRMTTYVHLQPKDLHYFSHFVAVPGLCGGRQDAHHPAGGPSQQSSPNPPFLSLQSQGFVEDGKVRTIPLEVMVKGDKVPVYEETLEENGR